MIRLLFWILLAVLAVGVLRAMARGRSARADVAGAPRPAPENMVRCLACGVNLPESDAVRTDAGWACSPAHARSGATGRR